MRDADRRTMPDARGREPLELLPYDDGLVLYDDERDLLAWARKPGSRELAVIVATVDGRDITRADVLEGAIRSLSRLRERRLEELANLDRGGAR